MSTVKLPQNALMDALNARPKHVFVAGASRGIGEAVARLLGESNYNLSLGARSYNRLLGLAMDLGTDRARAVRLDLEDSASIDSAVIEAESTFGPIDALVLAAGVNEETALDDLSPDARARFRRNLEVNVTGTWMLAQLATQHMTHGGRVVFIASVLSRKGAPGSYGYAASKHAVLALVRGMALDLARRNIRVNALCPSWVDTKMAHDVLKRIADAEGKPVATVMAEMLSAQPVRRMLKASEVAHYVQFLLGPAGDGVTGQAIDMSAGSTMV